MKIQQHELKSATKLLHKRYGVFKMDMLSLCRKRMANDSPEARRRSPRIAQKDRPSAAKKTTVNNITGDKCFANIDGTLPAISHSQNGNIILRLLAKSGDGKSRITGNCFTYDIVILCAICRLGKICRG